MKVIKNTRRKEKKTTVLPSVCVVTYRCKGCDAQVAELKWSKFCNEECYAKYIRGKLSTGVFE